MSDPRAYRVTVQLGDEQAERRVVASDVIEAVTMAIFNAFGIRPDIGNARCIHIERDHDDAPNPRETECRDDHDLRLLHMKTPTRPS